MQSASNAFMNGLPKSAEIYWDIDFLGFRCNNPELEEKCRFNLSSKLHSADMCRHLQALGFDIESIVVTILPLRPFPKNLEFYPKGLSFSSPGFSLGDMGSGFAICFFLIGYILASQSLGIGLRVRGGSFQNLLHPNLHRFLSTVIFSKNNRVYKECPYFAGSEHLKCTVNPSLPCGDCGEAPDSFLGYNLEWVEEW